MDANVLNGASTEGLGVGYLADTSSAASPSFMLSSSVNWAAIGASFASAPVTPTVLDVTSTASNSVYRTGASIPITVAFNEPVYVSGMPQLALNSGGTASYLSGSGTNTLTFTYTVQAGDYSTALDYASNSALMLNGGTIKDSASDDASLTLPSPGAIGSLSYSTDIAVGLPFIQSNSGAFVQSTSAETVTLANDVMAGDALVVAVSQWDSSTSTVTVTDNLGNTYVQIGSYATDGNARVSLWYAMDSAAGPCSVTVTPSDNAYLTFAVTEYFGITALDSSSISNGDSASVGPDTVNVNNGHELVVAAYTQGQAMLSSAAAPSGYAMRANVLNGNTTEGLGVADSANLSADQSPLFSLSQSVNFAAIGASFSTTPVAPKVVGVTSSAANQVYRSGDSIPITVYFSEPVNVTGSPELSLNSGGTAVYSSGSGSNVLTFTYSVESGDYSTQLDYAATSALTLAGGSIKDAAGDNAVLTLAAPGAMNSLSYSTDIQIGLPFVQSTSGAFAPSASPQSVTLVNSVASDDAIVVAVGEYDSPTGTVSVSDNLGNVYTQIGSYATSGNEHISLWYVLGAMGGSCTVTVTPSISAYLTVSVAEYYGLAALDSSSTDTGSGDSPTPGTIDVANSGDVIVAAYTQGETVLSSASAPSGYSMRTNVLTGTTTEGLGVADLARANSDVTPAFALSSTVNIWASIGASFTSVAPPSVTLINPGSESNGAGDAVNLPLMATDSAGNALAFSASGLPPDLSINPTTGVISGTVALGADSGSPYSVTVTATDPILHISASASFSWYISQVAVTLDNPGNQTNCIGDSISFALPRADSANDPLSFTAVNLPDDLTINPSTGQITGTISNDNPVNSSYSVTVKATDLAAGASASQTFTWSIVSLLLENPGEVDNFDGDFVELPLQTDASYAITDGLEFSETGLPPELTLNSSGVISGTIGSAADVNSPYSVSVSVTDPNAGTSSNVTFLWYVQANPVSVSLANPGDQYNFDGDSVNLPLMGLDSVGNRLTYTSTVLPPGLNLVGGSITGTLASNADLGGPYSITVTATDELANVSTSQTFTWYVSASVPTVSLINPGNEFNVDGDNVDVGLTASDSTGDPIAYSESGLPPDLNLVGNQIEGTIAADSFEGSPYPVTLTATDEGNGVQASQQFTWFCNASSSETGGEQTTTVLNSSASASNFGQSITLTATVGGLDGTPTGNVTFMDGMTRLGIVRLMDVGEARPIAVLTTSAIGIGTHSLTAVYSGDGTFAPSTSEPLIQTINGGFVTGEVWVDANANGLLDTGESGLDDVSVNLLNAVGEVVSTTTTDDNGMYNFSGLAPNTSYAIQVDQPGGYVFTYFQSGSNAYINSYTGPNGTTNSFQVAVGSTVIVNSGLVDLAELPANTVTGPGAVPGNSTYMYTISLPGQPFLTWATQIVSPDDPPGNTIAVGTMLKTYSDAANTTVESIPLTFGSGPADIILKAIVNGEVISTKEIYVVQVSVAQLFFRNDLHYSGDSGPTDLPLVDNGGIVVKGVASSPIGTFAAVWNATITLTGPGNNLGVDQINVGFIQHITIQSWSGQYALSADDGAGTPTHLVNSLQGQTFLDMAADPGETEVYTNRPWYDRTSTAMFVNATPGDATKLIESEDAPGMVVPLLFDRLTWPTLTPQLNNYNSLRPLQQVSFLANFTLDVAASTSDTANGANNSYWAEARANWSFNGTGTVDTYNMATKNALWRRSNVAGTSGDPSWTTIVAPTAEDTSGQIYNLALSMFSPAP